MHWSIGHMILDLVQNSIEAGAATIQLFIAEEEDRLAVEIADDGKGMAADVRAAALDPFYTDGVKHPGRKVGLGLPFLLQTLEQTNGSYQLDSEPGRGTRLSFELDLNHLDAPPFEDVARLVVDLMCFSGDYELVVKRKRNGREYDVSRGELIDVLGDLATIGNRNLAIELLLDWEADLLDAGKETID